MSRIVWDALGERLFEIGLDRGVLYTLNNEEEFTNGVPWNGLTAVDDEGGGREATPLYTDGYKVDAVYTNDEYGGTIKAYTYPREVEELFGEAQYVPGFFVRQQERPLFGFTYRTLIANDTEGESYGYRIHLVYNARVTDYKRSYSSVKSSIDAGEISIPFETFPLEAGDFYPFSEIVIDSTTFRKDGVGWLEDTLYGSESSDTPPRLPYPDELFEWFASEDISRDDWYGYPHSQLFPTEDLYPRNEDSIIDDDTMLINRSGSLSVTILADSTVSYSPTDFIDIPSGFSIAGITSYHTSDKEVVASVLTNAVESTALQFRNVASYGVATTITIYFLLISNS